MVINYCPVCVGSPYTRDLTVTRCPVCGSELAHEFVSDEGGLASRPTLAPTTDAAPIQPSGTGPFDPFGTTSSPFGDNQNALTGGAGSSGFSFGDFGDITKASHPSMTVEPLAAGTTEARPTTPLHRQPPTQQHTQAVPPATVTQRPAVQTTLQTIASQARREPSAEHSSPHVGSTIRGRVANYSNSESEPGMYRRLFFQRVGDALLYGQRFEDLIHRFTVRVSDDDFGGGDYIDVPVNVHGTISGGIQLMDNAEVEVTGRFRNGVLMARRIDVINGGLHTTVQFQRNVGAIVFGLALVAIVAFLALGGLDFGAMALGNLSGFLTNWAIVSLIVAALWFFVISHMGIAAQILFLHNGRFPFLGIVVIGFVLSLIMYNVLGLGTTAGLAFDALLSNLAPLVGPVLTLVIMIYALGLMFRGW